MIDEQTRILRTVSREKAFYFFTSIGNYTGLSGASLKEFLDRINVVDAKSLEFHLYRGDFERWASEVLQDEELVREVKRLQRFSLSGEALRNQLSLTVSKLLKRPTNQSGPSGC